MTGAHLPPSIADSHAAALPPNIQFRPWREFAILMMMVMELAWVVPWFRSLTPTAYAIPPARAFLVLFAVLLISHLLVRGLAFMRLRSSIRQGITLGLLVIGMVVGFKTLVLPHESLPLLEALNLPLRSLMSWKALIPDEFFILLAILITWWRGISLAQEHIGPGAVMDHFRVGIIMFVLFVFMNTLITGETPGIFFTLFIFSALLGMSSARISIIGYVRGGSLNSFDRKWFLGVISASVAVVLLATLLGELLGNEFSWVGLLLLGIFGILAMVLWLFISPILWLVIQLVNNGGGQSDVLKQLANQLAALESLLRQMGLRLSNAVAETGIMSRLAAWTPQIKLVILGGVLLLVTAGIVLWVRMQVWKDRRRKYAAEEQQGILGKGDLWKLLQSLLQQRWEALVSNLSQATSIRQRLRAATRVRQIYADMEDLCTALGHARNESQTPLEFIPVLSGVFPGLYEEIAQITTAYLKVRYGQLPESHQEVQAVESAWEKLSQAGKPKLEELKRARKSKEPLLPGSGQRPPIR